MKRKHLLLLVIIVCSYSSILYGQMFNNRYLFDQTAVVFRTIHTVEDTLLVVGLGTTWDFPYPGKLMQTRFDHFGEMLSYDLEEADSLHNYYPYGSDLLSQKLFIVGGVSTNQIADRGGFYALYDLNNNLQWFHEIEAEIDTRMFFWDCLILPNDRFLILVFQQSVGEDALTKLICVDVDGEILWEQAYHSPNYYITSGSITSLSDTVFLVGLEKGPFPSQGLLPRSSILKVDEMGNILSEWDNDEPVPSFAPYKILSTSDQGLIFAGRIYEEIPWPGWQSYICHLDSSFNKIWTIETGVPSIENYLNNLIPTSDGNFIAVGNTLDSLADFPNQTQSGYLIKFDIEGSILWEKRYFGIEDLAESNKFYDIIELEDESLVLCGASVELLADSFPAQGWLVRLNSDGQLDSTSSLKVIHSYNIDELLLFPNPTDAYLTVEFENNNIDYIEIFNHSGKRLYSQKANSNKLELDVSNFSSGFYFLRVNKRYSKKFVVD